MYGIKCSKLSYILPSTPGFQGAVGSTSGITGITNSNPISAITKTRLFKYTENLITKKIENSQMKNSNIFHISAQKEDCGYSLEPPRRGGSNEYPQSMF